MKIQKMTVVLVCGLLAASVFNSCSKSDGSQQQQGASGKAEKVTLTMIIGDTEVKNGIEAVATAAVEKFNIHIEFELKPGGEEGNNLVRSRLATGDMTDLLLYNSGSLFKTLDPQNYFYDLTGEAYVANFVESFK
jgi:raffinose/stachyose/melibiose transport system substrate-binding protein